MTDSPQPLLGILGGMGSLATTDFLFKLVTETPAQKDQDHVPFVVWNVPQIPSRQEALKANGISPLPEMLRGIHALNQVGATRIVIPCNTAHYWVKPLEQASQAPVIDIIETALDALIFQGSGQELVGILATRGLLEAGLYQARLTGRGLPWITNTEDELEQLVMPGCYAVKKNQLQEGGQLLDTAAERLVAQGATRLILACTEIPPALKAVDSAWQACSIDPTLTLAQACVRYWQTHRDCTGKH